MGLPGYPGEEERKEEEDYDCYPEWHGDRDEKYVDWYPGDYYRQCPTNGEDSPRGSYAYDVRRGKENIKSISCQSTKEKYCQEASLPRCPEEEASQEIQAYHIEYNMGKTAVDKYGSYDGPGLLRKQHSCQAKRADNFIVSRDGIPTDRYLDYEDYDI